VSAHNEETWIPARIENALKLKYPKDKLEILIASDGSVDHTNDIVRNFSAASTNVRLLDYAERRGKAAALNASIPRISAEIVVFSDANTLFKSDAIQRLVSWFADPSVGVVCGKPVLTDSLTAENVDGLYWRYETFIKTCEGKLGSLLGANGAIYAMRRELFCPIPDNTIVDDLVIPLLAKCKHGCRIVYDPEAVAYEETAPSIGDEFRRRVRIGTGDYQSLFLLWPLLNPRHGWTTFSFLGHKVLRWASPFFLAIAAIANLLLLPKPIYVLTMTVQVAFYGTALCGARVRGNNWVVKFMRGISLFCSVNAALFVGFFRWLCSEQTGTWRRTQRETDLAK
jgi:cellulose synthase/poly-beta-1,6-N-acetylglucosamine synthase-like glycosyltransferase